MSVSRDRVDERVEIGLENVVFEVDVVVVDACRECEVVRRDRETIDERE